MLLINFGKEPLRCRKTLAVDKVWPPLQPRQSIPREFTVDGSRHKRSASPMLV